MGIYRIFNEWELARARNILVQSCSFMFDVLELVEDSNVNMTRITADSLCFDFQSASKEIT